MHFTHYLVGSVILPALFLLSLNLCPSSRVAAISPAFSPQVSNQKSWKVIEKLALSSSVTNYTFQGKKTDSGGRGIAIGGVGPYIRVVLSAGVKGIR